MLKIVNVPNSVLTTKAKPVQKIDAKIEKLIKDMAETLEAQVDPQGVGLAAPQVGVSLQLFVIKPTKKAKIEAFINPRIIEVINSEPPKKSKKDSTALEGCLSIPKIWSPVHRPHEVVLEYTDVTGKIVQRTFKNFAAVIIQHEVDHLDGILFTQRALEQQFPVFEEKNGKLEQISSI